MTMYPPADSMNSLSTSSRSSFQLEELMYDSGYPETLPNGTFDTAEALIQNSTSNSNYTTWYLKINPDIKWSDGTNVTSEDLLATFGPNFALNATYDFPNLHLEVAKEYAANSTTAVYVLNKPDALWPLRLSNSYFTVTYPASIIQKEGASSNLYDSPTAGPFYVSKFSSGATEMTLLRNPYYTPQPKICEVDINFVEAISLTSSYLQGGTTDLAPVEPASVASVLAANPHLHVLDGANLIYTGLMWNVTSYPYNMTAFRQALAFGINQSQIVKQAFAGYASPAYNAEGTIPQATSAWYNPNQVKYNFSQSEALALLKSINIVKGSDGHLQYPNGTDVSLSLYTDNDQTWDVLAAGIVTSNLQALGFKVTQQSSSAPSLAGDYFQNVAGIQHDMILYSTPGVSLSDPFLMNLPGWDTTWLPTLAPSSGCGTNGSNFYGTNGCWEYPPQANSWYNGNYTAYSLTTNLNQQKVYTDNIQAINAQYLPILTLDYANYVWMGNTATWSNWPPSNEYVLEGGSHWNRTAFVDLVPATGGSSSSFSSSTGPSVSTQTVSTSATSSATQTVATSTITNSGAVSSSTSSGSNSLLIIVAGVVILAIVIAAGVILAFARRGRGAPRAT